MSKTLKRHFIAALDHGMHRVGWNYLSDSPKFGHYDATVMRLEGRDRLYQQEAADYWCAAAHQEHCGRVPRFQGAARTWSRIRHPRFRDAVSARARV